MAGRQFYSSAAAEPGRGIYTTSGTGHAFVDKGLVTRDIEREIVLRVSSFPWSGAHG